MLWEFMISCDNLKNVVVSTQRDNYKEHQNPWKSSIFKGFIYV